MKIKVIEVEGRPHTLTQTNGSTFRLFPRQTKVIDEKLISSEFKSEQKAGNIELVPIKDEEPKHSKGGTK